MSDSPMPKVELHDILNNIDVDAASQPEDYRPLSARIADNDSGRSDSPRQQENEYSRMGGLMLAIFPDGLNLASEEDFASFYLYARVVEHVSRFGQHGMTDREAIHNVAIYSALLENRIILHR